MTIWSRFSFKGVSSSKGRRTAATGASNSTQQLRLQHKHQPQNQQKKECKISHAAVHPRRLLI